MRRVAEELGAGTMTLYHYVRTKDELLALMDDAIMGEMLIPADELPTDWRAAVTAIARRAATRSCATAGRCDVEGRGIGPERHAPHRAVAARGRQTLPLDRSGKWS